MNTYKAPEYPFVHTLQIYIYMYRLCICPLDKFELTFALQAGFSYLAVYE